MPYLRHCEKGRACSAARNGGRKNLRQATSALKQCETPKCLACAFCTPDAKEKLAEVLEEAAAAARCKSCRSLDTSVTDANCATPKCEACSHCSDKEGISERVAAAAKRTVDSERRLKSSKAQEAASNAKTAADTKHGMESCAACREELASVMRHTVTTLERHSKKRASSIHPHRERLADQLPGAESARSQRHAICFGDREDPNARARKVSAAHQERMRAIARKNNKRAKSASYACSAARASGLCVPLCKPQCWNTFGAVVVVGGEYSGQLCPGKAEWAY